MSDPERKLAARRNNERVKMLAGTLNALALGILAAAFVVPGVTSLANVRWIWIPAAIILHLLAYVAYGFLKSED